MKRLLCWICIVTAFNCMMAQDWNTYLVVKGGLKTDFEQITGMGNAVQTAQFVTPGLLSLEITQRLSSHLDLRVGLTRSSQHSMIKLDESTAPSFLNLPSIPHKKFTGVSLAVATPINLVRKRFFMRPMLGIAVTFIDRFSLGTFSFQIYPNPPTQEAIRVAMDILYARQPSVSINPQASIEFAVEFRNGMRIGLEPGFRLAVGNWYSGTLDYQYAQDPPLQGRIQGGGGMGFLCVGLQYPISRIWSRP